MERALHKNHRADAGGLHGEELPEQTCHRRADRQRLRILPHTPQQRIRRLPGCSARPSQIQLPAQQALHLQEPARSRHRQRGGGLCCRAMPLIQYREAVAHGEQVQRGIHRVVRAAGVCQGRGGCDGHWRGVHHGQLQV